MTEHRLASGRREAGRLRLRNGWLLMLPLLLMALASSASAIASSTKAKARGKAKAARANPFAGRGMWIWVLSDSNGGNLRSIIATARRYGIHTLMIKSGDGSSAWSQFNPSVVATLHAAGLRVCAWQYVYGDHPVSEASVGAEAVHDGANCLLIDAEAEYEGRYVQAQTYIQQLRKLIGSRFPVALASFPYVDYHPAFPYSVFLGPGGAQYNVPQMYWKDIGTSVDTVYSHTYMYNRMYQRPVSPLGQTFQNPPSNQIVRFRQLSRAYGASGVSWWDWQESDLADWRAVARPVGPVSHFSPIRTLATLTRGWQGDLVVWAQEHLISAGYNMPVDGGFGPKTQTAVESFQRAHGLPADGVIATTTWEALLRYRPAAVNWTSSGAKVARAASATTSPVPKSAHLRAKRDEIPGTLGAGWPSG